MIHFYDKEIDCAYRLFYNIAFFHGHNILLQSDFAHKCLPIPDDITFHDIWFTALACFLGGIAYSDKVICKYRQHQKTVTSHRKYSLFKELKMRHHFDFGVNRINLYKQLIKRDDISSHGLLFLEEFRQYAIKCPFLKYRLWCWKWRFSHYKLIYTTDNYRYFLLRSIHYLLTPSFIKKADVITLSEKSDCIQNG